MLHYQNVNEVSEATGDQTSEIPLTENHHGIGQNFMLPVRLPVLGLHGKKMPSFIHDPLLATFCLPVDVSKRNTQSIPFLS